MMMMDELKGLLYEEGADYTIRSVGRWIRILGELEPVAKEYGETIRTIKNNLLDFTEFYLESTERKTDLINGE